MEEMEYEYIVSGNAPMLYPSDTFFGLLYYNGNDAVEVPKCYPYQAEWGKPVSTHLLNDSVKPLPTRLDMIWISVVERKFYSIEALLPIIIINKLWKQTDRITGEPLFFHIIVGMAPYGGVAIWTHGFRKSALVTWMKAEEIGVEMKDFMPINPTLTLNENCDFYINNDKSVKENLEKNGLPSRNLFDKYMQQFCYRYLFVFEKWDESDERWLKYDEDEAIPEFDYIEETLFDGTHDKLHDVGLLKYHDAGKPKKLAIKWHINKVEYAAYFWLEDENICTIYDKFYGIHREAKVDFIIHIDSEKKKYQLSLYRSGLKEPLVIAENAYQLIVFKNKFEHYRSENYNQERGAWLW